MSGIFNISVAILTLIVMLVGLLGLVVPIFPGLVIIWLAGLGFGIVNGFSGIGGWVFGGMTVLMFAGVSADNILFGIGARKGGAAWSSIGIALVSGIIGTFLLPPLGGLIAAPAALFLVEFKRSGNREMALSSTRGMLIGCGWAFVTRFLLGLAMIGGWAFWAIKS